ncbi:hypothetical protein [Streptomyces sp. NPDC056480]|uniref:hypothetical protein n=1 Tax=Streptomyces sp. NPDC056480 TaxID=3345833 RepID=UPI0036CF6FFA
MSGLWQYFEENNEIFAALVAALAILGGLLGSVIGAKIQANGGRDQAAAAREAAAIAAEAQRVAALWTVRQVQIAEYIQGVRKVDRLACQYYLEDSADGALRMQLDEVQEDLSLKQAELELVAPTSVVHATRNLMFSINKIVQVSASEGPGAYRYHAVHSQTSNEESNVSALARQAVYALNNLRRASESGDLAAREAAYQVASQAVCSSMGWTPRQTGIALRYCLNTRSAEGRRRRAKQGLHEGTDALIEAARTMLKSEDDVAPTVPTQRRRWLRRSRSEAVPPTA